MTKYIKSIHYKDKMKNILIMILLVLIIVSPLISSEIQTLPTTEKGECIILRQSHPNATSINITSIKYPNSSETYDIIEMNTTNNINYFYEFCNTSQIGSYIVTTCGDGDGETTCMDYDLVVSRSGKDFNSQDGGLAIAILIGVLGSSVIFMIMGNKLSENTKTMPLALIFAFLSITLVLYSLNLGWVYSQNIMQFDAIGNVSQVIFTSFLWIVIGVVIISMALMLISFIMHLTKVVERKKFGEDFDPISETYI